MSERKTAEIKFRIAPSEKAAWQARADQEQIGLSELIRRSMTRELHPLTRSVVYNGFDPGTGTLYQRTASYSGDVTTGIAAGPMLPAVRDQGTCPAPGGCETCPTPDCCRSVRVEVGLETTPPQEDVTPATQSVGTSDEAGDTRPSWLPFTFEAQNGG